jgi:hypothetical protein
MSASGSRDTAEGRRNHQQFNRGTPSKKFAKHTPNGEDIHYEENDDVDTSGHSDDVKKHHGVQRHSTDRRSQMSYVSSTSSQVVPLSLLVTLIVLHVLPTGSTLFLYLFLASLLHLNCASELHCCEH